MKFGLALGIAVFFLFTAASSRVHIWDDGTYRYIESNGIPDHRPGRFPNAGNPNSISAQDYSFRVPLHPEFTGRATPYGHNLFGVAINGVPFDPGTAEVWNNDPRSGWNYEALSGKINLGIDSHNAHVQPGGKYHYHGIPVGLMSHGTPQFAGYAADGFPVYVGTGMHSSYRLKRGTRPSGPGGTYDGTFVQDYEYVKGWGNLDECNGKTGPMPNYPDGIYHYYLTDTFPFIPRCHQGEADPSFTKERPHTAPGGQGAGRQGPEGGGPGGRRTPPPEAIQACGGRGEGESCSFQAPHGTESGTCRSLQGQMACVPAHPPRR